MFGLIHLVGAGAFDFNATAKATLPGASTAEKLVSGIMFYSLVFCLVGLVLSAGMWAVGAFSNNYTQSVNGKKGFLICAGSALAIGAAKALVQYFYNEGSGVK